ncbi:MAG: V-type ATP synthase subunit E [Candidatus Hydrogenedentota bacterium]
MRRDADKRCQAILDEAREEAARIVAEARQTAEENRGNAVREEQKRAREELEEARQRAQAEAERAKVTMREQVADRVLEKVREELRNVAESPEFPEIVRLLLAEIIEETFENAIVLAPPKHVATCREWLDAQDRAHIAVEPDERLRDGVAVTNAARSFRLTNTLTSRFEKIRASARKTALRRLFGDNS